MSPRFLFLMRGGFDPTVIDSQVVDSIAALQPHGVRFELVAFTEGSTWFGRREEQRARRAEIERRLGTRVRAYLTPRQGRPEGNAIATALLCGELARGIGRRTVVHARGDGAAAYARRAQRLWPRLRYVWDVRGDSEAEFLLHPDIAGLTEARRQSALASVRRERTLAASGASHVFCVSEVLRQHTIERYGLPPDRVTVVPCVADTEKFRLDEADREATRRELGLSDRFVIVYPGRFGRWHYGPETASVVQGIMREHPDAYFLVLTPDTEEANRLLGAALPAGSWEVRSARHAEVPRFLRAGDLGVLLRERHPLNEAACPTKFAEYVTSGVPILISAGIGDCSGFVARHGAGMVLDEPDPRRAAAALTALRAEPARARRERIAKLGETFARARVAARMAEVYLRLAGS